MNTEIPTAQEQERPPHIEFKLQPVEDRQKTNELRKKFMRDEEFAFISPRGGKDKVKKKIPQPPKPGEMPSFDYQDFMARFGPQYEAWKKGLAVPVEGTDIRQFALLSAAEQENCRTFNIFTVEQLAEANEETLTNLGMGSRGLKMKAQRWLEFGENGGKQVTHIEDLETRNKDLEDLVKRLTARVEELEADEPKKRGPGRPKKES